MTEDLFTDKGEFSIGGLSLDEFMKGLKTPFYVYSADVIRNKFDRLASQFPDFKIYYSFKSNPNLSVANVLRNRGACAEISSIGELRAALKAGFRPDDIIFVSPAKTEEEIELAISEGIYALICDSRYEIELIDKIAGALGKEVRVMLRINTVEGPKVAPEIMIGVPSKFGFDEERIPHELAGIKLKNTRLIGIQVYAASQVLDPLAIAIHFDNVFKAAFRIRNFLGIEIEAIDFGGGFGVPYGSEPELNLAIISEKAKELIGRYESELPGCRFILEMGRYLVAECGIFVTRVMRTKESRGIDFVICDGGLNCLTRPAFMHVKHKIKILNKWNDDADRPYKICGPCCTPIDVIGDMVEIPTPEIGDVIGVFNAGAYGYSMSMLHFISFDLPGEYIVDAGEVAVAERYSVV